MFNDSGINNRNISYQYRDREEFIEEFLRKKDNNTNNSYISSPKLIYPIRRRWNYLYNLNKLYKFLFTLHKSKNLKKYYLY
jgi:hypothetical protein